MDIDAIRVYALQAVGEVIDLVADGEYFKSEDEKLHVAKSLTQEKDGSGRVEVAVMRRPNLSFIVHMESQRVEAICQDMVDELGCVPKSYEDALSFIDHTLDPVNPISLNENRFNRAFESLLARADGWDSARHVVLLNGFAGSEDLWSKRCVALNPVSPMTDMEVKRVEIRVAGIDELTEYMNLPMSKVSHAELYISKIAFVASFDFKYPGIYPTYSAEMREYVTDFLLALRLHCGTKIGYERALCMFELDLPPISINEYLSRAVRPLGERQVFALDDLNHFNTFWHRYAVVSRTKIAWPIKRFMKAFAEEDQVDTCIDLLIALQSLYGAANYAVALRAAASIGLDGAIDYDIFDFAQNLMKVRNNLFHGSSQPFKAIENEYELNEFVKGALSLVRGCITRLIWLDEATRSDLRNLRNIIEKSIWDESTREELRSLIPEWSRMMVTLPTKVTQQSGGRT